LGDLGDRVVRPGQEIDRQICREHDPRLKRLERSPPPTGPLPGTAILIATILICVAHAPGQLLQLRAEG
jgi:hypothetical protein